MANARKPSSSGSLGLLVPRGTGFLSSVGNSVFIRHAPWLDSRLSGWRASIKQTIEHISKATSANSHVPVAAQLLEGVFAFLVLGAAGALAGLGVAEFFDDLADVPGVGFDREGAGMATDAPIPLPVAVGEIERDDRDILPLDIFPDVQLRPVQERMDADVGAFLEIGLKLVPKLGWLVFDVPFHVSVARADVAFLGARRLFVAAHANDDAGEAVLFEHGFEAVFFQRAAALDAGGLAVGVGDTALEDGR